MTEEQIEILNAIAEIEKEETKEYTIHPKKYKKKPVEVEALLYNGENFDDVKKFCGECFYLTEHEDSVFIYTLEGTMEASAGDYIIKGVYGECYPCKPDIFSKTYEEI